MAQYEIQLKDLIRIVKKRRKVIFFSAVALSVLSFLFALIQSPAPLYQATTKVKYDKSQTLAGMITTVFYWSPYDNIYSQTKIIKSFPVLEKAAKRVGLLDERLDSTDILTSKEYMGVISLLEAQTETQPEENTNIIRINVTNNDPEMAAALANAIAESYREYNVEEINKRTIDTKNFIEDQLKIVTERLKDAEDQYRKFQEEKDIVSLDNQALMDLQSLAGLESEYDRLKRENTTLEFFKKEISSKNISSKQSFTLNETDINSSLYKLNDALQDLLLERDKLLAVYTNQHPQIKELNKKISEILNLISGEIKSRMSTNNARMEVLKSDIDNYKKRTSEYPDDNLTLARFQREVELQTDLYSELNSRYQEILIQESGMIEEVVIVTPALVPEKPMNPPKSGSSLIIGLFMGLLLGIFFSIVMENLDTSIGTIEDVESYLEIPVLGVIPYVSSIKEVEEGGEVGEVEAERDQKESPLIIRMSPKSQMVEAYRSLRTNILFINREKEIKTIMITSSSLQEGKTVNCVNIAVSMALGGYRTLLVEADLRRATIGKIFGIDKSPGLSDIILGSQDWRAVTKDMNDFILSGFDMNALIKTPELSNLNLITSGAFPTNPSELINSRQMSKFVEDVKGEYDFVIFDCPPVLPVTDAVLLSQKVDGVMILYEVGKIARGVLKRTKSHLDNVKANVLGIILNGVRPEYGPDYYEYQYQYYYEEGERSRKPSDWEKIKDNLRKEKLQDILSTLKDKVVTFSKEKITPFFAKTKERLSRLFKKKSKSE